MAGYKFDKRPQGKLKERSLALTGPGESTQHVEGATSEVKTGWRQRVSGRTWGTCFLWEEGFGVLALTSDWSIQTKKSQVSVSSTGLLSKGHQSKGSEKQGRLLLTSPWGFRGGDPIRNLRLLMAVIWRVNLLEGTSVSRGRCRSLGNTQ